MQGVARFDRYMLAQLMVLFGFFALVLVMVYWINRAVVLFDQLIADGQSAGVFLEFTALSLPNIIRIVLPLAAFAASLYVTNRMIAESEMVVVQATGFSPFRLARPVVFFGVIVAILMSVLTHYIAPLSAARLGLRQAEIAQNASARLLREGQFLAPTDGVTFYIREISAEGALRDIFLSDTRNARDSVTYTASSAYLLRSDSGPQLVMLDGLAQTLRRDTMNLVTTRFDELAYDIGAMVRLPDATRRSSRELPTAALLFPTPEVIAETRKSEGALIVEGHGRFSEALLAPVAALLGFATLLTGGFSRFGVWRQVVAAIFLVIVVKMVETLSVAVVRDVARLWPLTYLPALTGAAIAWFLLFWASRPYLLRRRPRPDAGTAAGTEAAR